MRRRLLLIALLALAFPASASAATVFFVPGHGWGHGIGMSQYGAQGFATRANPPKTYDWILAHYYSGTTLMQLSRNPSVKVLLADGRLSLTIGSAARFTVTDSAGHTFKLAARDHRIGPGLRIVDVNGNAHRLASPARFRPGTRPLRLSGRSYRGWFGVNSTGTSLSAVNHVGLEQYIYGVVPREMPSSWAPEALKAQAVAARSYAYVAVAANVPYLYPDTRSQVYGGISAETTASNAAVDATARQVVAYNGRAVRTYFFSTSGGRTAAAEDGPWGSGPIPYLKSVDDPFDDISPYHTWGPIRYTSAALARRAGGPAGLRDATVAVNPSLRADSVTLVGASATRTISGATFQYRLGLRSTWFRIRVLSLTAARRKITYGGAVKLSGFERGLDGIGVQLRAYGGSWESPTAVSPDSSGHFEVIAKPSVTTSYRATSSAGRGAVIHVAVAPRVRVGYARGVFSGSVAPAGAAAGHTVSIQRRAASGWTTVASGTIRADGSFRVAARAAAGTYRARVALGGGYAVGTATIAVP